MNGFEKDLQFGTYYEREALKLFEYDKYEMSKGCFKYYDIKLFKDDKVTFVEVKSDRMATKTGNLCIEYECNKKPSGISVTTADVCVYFIIHERKEIEKELKVEIYIIPTDKLKQISKKCKSVKGGDGYKSKLYLVNKELVIDYLFLDNL
jgi:hypothetical protein